MKTPKPGRPKLPSGEAKSLFVGVRVTPDDFKTVCRAAKRTGDGISEWARKVLISAAAVESESYLSGKRPIAASA